MSIFSNGDEPGEKEPNPKRRRTRRPGNRAGRGNKQAPEATPAAAGPATGKLEAVGRASFNEKNGSRTPTSYGRGNHNLSGDVNHGSSGDMHHGQIMRVDDSSAVSPKQSQDGVSSGKRRKRRKRRAGNQSAHPAGTQMRNVRSMPKPAKDAEYKAPMEPKPAARPKPHHHAANNRRRNPHAGPQQRSFSSLYAALDLGTNNCRLLVATPQDRGRFRVVDGFSRIVRLGEGLEQSGELSAHAMDRAVEALKVCADKLANRNVRKQRLIATEACRQASNGEMFLKRVKEETGLELEIVNRETEARLAAEGCGSLMDRKSDGAVLFDIGGGSSELILVDNSQASKKAKKNRIGDRIVAWTSLPMGVVTLAERFGGKDVTRELFDDMVRDVAGHIEAFAGRDALASAFASGRVHLLGTSGTVTTLAGVHLGLPKYDRRRVDGIWLRDAEVDTVINKLIDMSYSDRAKNPCIGEERADLVLAGCAILNAIRLAWPTERLRVADRGLREGLLAQMMNSDRAWARRYRDRRLYGRRPAHQRKPDKGGGQT